MSSLSANVEQLPTRLCHDTVMQLSALKAKHRDAPKWGGRNVLPVPPGYLTYRHDIRALFLHLGSCVFFVSHAQKTGVG